MTIFFSISKVLSFRDGRISLFQRQNFFPEIFANLIVAFLKFVSLQMLYLYLFFRLCMRSHPASHTPSHARSQAHTTHPSILSHMRHAQSDSLASPIRGRGWCPIGASRWRRWTWLLSTESRHSYTMGPFTHMSDSVADWGRGTLRVAPSSSRRTA